MSDPSEQIHHYELNGHAYDFHKLPATKAQRLITRLFKSFGDGFVQIMLTTRPLENTNGKAAGPSNPTAEELQRFGANLSIFERLPDDILLELERLVFVYAFVDGKRIYNGADNDFDVAFKDCPLDIFLVLWEAIKFNLGPFLPAIQSRFAALQTGIT